MDARDYRILQLEKKTARLEKTLYSAIAWIARSAASPLSHMDAEALIRMIDGDDNE